MKKQNRLILRGMCGALLLVATVSNNVSAVESQMPFSINVVSEAVLSLTLDGATNDGVVIDVTPTGWDGTFGASDDLDVTVTTNNRYGFTLGMTTTSSDLAPEVDNGYVIESVDASENGYTSANFPVNKWGYALKTNETFGNYFAVGDGVELQNSDTAALAGSTSTLKFGVKVDPFIPSGSYETTIVFTATTKPQILYMQDVAEWGSSVALGQSVKAVDTRDMKEYWVTRVEVEPADNEFESLLSECSGEGLNKVCSQLMMTQNLDYDLVTGATALTPEDTDLGYVYRDYSVVMPGYSVSVSWIPQVATADDVDDFTATTNAERSFDPGDVYYYSSGDDTNDTVYYSLDECTQAGHLLSDCEHYHVGNYYNFYAATAGGGTVTLMEPDSDPETYTFDEMYESSGVTTTAPRYMGSVCPAGWRLPFGVSDGTGANGDPLHNTSDFESLLYKNNITPQLDSEGENIGFMVNGFTKIRVNPLWFVRAGVVYPGYGFILQSERGFYWSNTASNTDNAYGVGFGYADEHGGEYIFPSGFETRVSGYPIRCIAWTEDFTIGQIYQQQNP